MNNSLPVARPGLRFIIIALAVWLICLIAGWCVAAVFFFLLLGFVSWFFRDPERPTPPEGFGLSPADGRVIKIEYVEQNPYTNAPARKVSIFMSVFNVHVNRTPVSGRILSQTYFPGAFVNASFDKASEHNERNALVLDTPQGPVAMVQIAGLVARRIVSWVGDGDELRRGQRVGMIRFGSRVDLYLPTDSEIMVTIGQNVSAGWSPIWRDGSGGKA
ncbi:phosphatidylserine decarboxylase family protein [Deltaproteobacteria bacterium Smac51]|nr:phosphatidylserine decarboxylase family protein [Deltaproteobacteria bacterium Smac51]